MASALRERYDQLKKSEGQRDKLIEELLEENDGLKKNLAVTENQLERVSDRIQSFQQRYEAATEDLQRLTDAHAYVCVVIDGNCTLFRDELVKNATVGGQDAAKLLRSAIADYVKTLQLCQGIDILIYIYANVHGLAEIYCASQLLQNTGIIDRFICGFNISHPLANFTDAGRGQESTTSKIFNFFELNMHNMHCKHLILGISHDSYTPLLQKYANEKTTQNRITLLEGLPFTREISTISCQFKTKAFSQIFRNAKIEPKIESIESMMQTEFSRNRDAVTINSSVPRDTALGGQSHPAERLVDYLDTHPAEQDGGQRPFNDGRLSPFREESYSRGLEHKAKLSHRPGPEMIVYPPELFKDAPPNFVARNQIDHRVDVPLSQPSSGLLCEIRFRKLCNDHCLGGRCSNVHCRHEHPMKLGRTELHALRVLARSIPCRTGLRCNDKLCFHGHNCPASECEFGQTKFCRYPQELHGTFAGIVNKEDFDRLNRDTHTESRIPGVTGRFDGSGAGSDPKSSQNHLGRTQSGKFRYSNITMKFENTPNSELRPDTLTTMSIQPATKLSSRNSDQISTKKSSTTFYNSDTARPLSSRKDRVSTSHVPTLSENEPRVPTSPVRDPRPGARKRIRLDSP